MWKGTAEPLCSGIHHSHVTVSQFLLLFWPVFRFQVHVDGRKNNVGHVLSRERVAQPTHDIKERWATLTLTFLKGEERKREPVSKTGL